MPSRCLPELNVDHWLNDEGLFRAAALQAVLHDSRTLVGAPLPTAISLACYLNRGHPFDYHSGVYHRLVDDCDHLATELDRRWLPAAGLGRLAALEHDSSAAALAFPSPVPTITVTLGTGSRCRSLPTALSPSAAGRCRPCAAGLCCMLKRETRQGLSRAPGYQRLSVDCRPAGAGRHSGQYPDGAPGAAVPAAVSGGRHARRRRRHRRHSLRRFRPRLPGRQPGAGGHPARWRHAHQGVHLSRHLLAVADAGHLRGGADRRRRRPVRHLAARCQPAVRAPARRHRRLHRRRGGVQPAA